MQKELAAEGLSVRILGVNATGHESANELMVCSAPIAPGTPCPEESKRLLPLLQDVVAVNAWGIWAVQWRDVVIVDSEQHEIERYNLTSHDLSVPANYEELKAKLRAAQ